MTHAKQVTQAVSAMRKARPYTDSSAEPAAMTFVIYEDNVGRYRWRIVASGGETLVRSASFGSCEDARQAARIVHRGASRASFEDSSGPAPPADLLSTRNRITVTLRDRQDAERWLDEGGSFRSEALTR